MKLEALFKSQNKKLVRIADEKEISLENIKSYKAENIETTVSDSDYFCIEIPWSTVEMDDGIYNEEFLANLRDFLKKAESRNQFAIIIPIIDKDFSSDDKKEAFIDAFNHTARRIKDCVSVIGMELPEGLIMENQAISFMKTLAIKHAQYLYFVKEAFSSKIDENNDFGIIIY